MKIYLFASKGISLTSKIIKFWQFGFPYTHTGFIVDGYKQVNPLIAEMWFEGFRITSFYKGHTEGTNYIVYSLDVNEEQYDEFERIIYSYLNNPPKYDWLGILGFPLRNKNINLKKRYFCSEFCFYVLQQIGINLLINTTPSEVSPRLILKSPLLNYEYYCNGKNIIK
jgi:hypothetical protein